MDESFMLASSPSSPSQPPPWTGSPQQQIIIPPGGRRTESGDWYSRIEPEATRHQNERANDTQQTVGDSSSIPLLFVPQDTAQAGFVFWIRGDAMKLYNRTSFVINGLLGNILRQSHLHDLQGAATALQKHSISDSWLPVPKQTLRHVFSNSDDLKSFSKIQDLSLSREFDYSRVQNLSRSHTYGYLQIQLPESGHSTFHAAFEDGDDIIQVQRPLGEGACGVVEEVLLPNNSSAGLVCVRKKIGRPRQLKAQKQIMEAFVREVAVMRQVNHPHCVRLLGSYTDFESVNILISPVADTDLAAFLDQPLEHKQKEFLFKGIHCLCNALDYLHQKKIRHEDLKPQNVLVHGECILLTDFGFSLDFSDDSVSTTTGRPSAWTIRYSAPEVLDFEPRNRASDIFSLGCVLYEMISAIDGHTLSAVKDHWKRSGNGQSSFARNPDAASVYMEPLPSSFVSGSLPHLRTYTRFMLHPLRDLRPSAQQVVDRISDLSSFFPNKHLNGLECCSPSLDKHWWHYSTLWTLPDHFFLPLTFNGWAYILLDLDFNRIASYPPNVSRIVELNPKTHEIGRDLYEGAQRRRNYPELWLAHEAWKQGQDNLFGAKLHMEISARILSIKHVTVTNWDTQVFEYSGLCILRPVQISLVPICLPRSPYYGAFFFMLSYLLP